MPKESVVNDIFSFSPDFKKELTAIKKANQIGKKLSDSGDYIMYDTMMMSYDTSNPHYSVAFLKDKVLESLVLLAPHVISINGNELYKFISNGTFVGYENLTNKISLMFDLEEGVTPEFKLDEFSKYACKHGLTDFEVVVASSKGWSSNMDVYNMYLKYMSILESSTQKKIVRHKFNLQFTNFENEIIQKVSPVIDEIQNNKFLLRHNITGSELEEFLDSDVPTEIIETDCDGNSQYIRIMKNMFPTISTSSELSVSLVTCNDNSCNYLLTEVDSSDATVVNIFKVFAL